MREKRDQVQINNYLRLEKAQAEWDSATNAYSRYPSEDNWQRFLECKRIVLALREEELHAKTVQPKQEEEPPVVKDSLTGREGGQEETRETTDIKIYDFLMSLYPQIMESKDIVKGCGITKHQMRHGLLKLLKQEKIEKIGRGNYQAIKP